MEDDAIRLSFYQRLVGVKNEEQIEVLRYDFKDRFGQPPPQVENMLYAIKLKLLAGRAGIESISSEDGWVILRKLAGMRFDKDKLESLLKDGIKLGITQVSLDCKKLGSKWREVLEEVLEVA
jgi:transcription-repair coupling factor (superfamily II helicase)